MVLKIVSRVVIICDLNLAPSYTKQSVHHKVARIVIFFLNTLYKNKRNWESTQHTLTKNLPYRFKN